MSKLRLFLEIISTSIKVLYFFKLYTILRYIKKQQKEKILKDTQKEYTAFGLESRHKSGNSTTVICEF